ncbi:hypothetical protein HKD37_20G056717 [Glycine soja]
MGFRVLGVSLLIFIYLINLAPAYPLQNKLFSETDMKSSIIAYSYSPLLHLLNSKYEDKGIYESKIEGGAGHGGSSHGNGNSRSPETRGGGAAVIPVYAAGAANKNHQHQTRHGAANCNLNKIRFSNMLMIISWSILSYCHFC